MAIVEKISHEELYLLEILRNPVLFIEFLNNLDLTDRDSPMELTDYQKEFVCDFNSYQSLCCGRALGKTFFISNYLIWLLVFKVFPGDYIVYFVPGKAQLDPVWTNLVRMFRTNSLLQHYLTPNAGVNSSEFRITLLNQSSLLCRIAGQSGTGANVIGLHTPFVVVDEAGYFPWNVFMEMQPILNTFTPGYKLIVSGVPSGVRERNVLYHCDQENSLYSKHRVSSLQNPRFTEKDKKFAIEQYGGEDSEEYLHYVLGQHGRPVFSLFDRSAFSMESYPVYKLDMDGTRTENLSTYINKFSILPAIPLKDAQVIIGIDLGYTEPTAIVVMYQDGVGRFKFHARIKLTKVSYPIQEKLINYLDTKYAPEIIGIDRGNAGISIIQNLIESQEYSDKKFAKRIVPIDFSSWLSLGTDSNGEEIKTRTKPFTVTLLQDYSNSHKIVYSTTDLEMVTELERMTYIKSDRGDISYRTLTLRGGKKGEDHFTSALLCATAGYYLTNELVVRKRKRQPLYSGSWF